MVCSCIGNPSADCQENVNPVVYFPFFSGLPKKNWQVALITGEAMSSAGDNVIDTATNVIGFLTVHIG